jgi:hypothetical protein
MLKRNLVEKIGESFQFTKAHKVFLDFALELIEKEKNDDKKHVPPTLYNRQ